MFVKICSNFNGPNLFRPCSGVVRKFFPFQVAGKIHSRDRRSARPSTIPVQETASFRFVKPESFIKNRLKEEASSNTTPSCKTQLQAEHHPVERGREKRLAGLILYYL